MTAYHLFMGSMSVLVLTVLWVGIGFVFNRMVGAADDRKHKALDAAVKSDFSCPSTVDPDTATIRALQLAEAMGARSKATVRLQILDAQQVLVDAGFDTKLVPIGDPVAYVLVARKGTRIELIAYRSA